MFPYSKAKHLEETKHNFQKCFYKLSLNSLVRIILNSTVAQNFNISSSKFKNKKFIEVSSSFYDTINKIDETLARLTKETKREDVNC